MITFLKILFRRFSVTLTDIEVVCRLNNIKTLSSHLVILASTRDSQWIALKLIVIFTLTSALFSLFPLQHITHVEDLLCGHPVPVLGVRNELHFLLLYIISLLEVWIYRSKQLPIFHSSYLCLFTIFLTSIYTIS